MAQTLEERKQELRENLKLSLISFKKTWSDWSSKPDVCYRSTWEIANTPPYFQSSEEIFIVQNEWRMVFVGAFTTAFGIWFLIIATMGSNTNVIAFLGSMAFVIMGIAISIRALDKRTKIWIDKTGIFYYKWPKLIEWKDIIATYMEEKEDGEHTTRNLLIYFHDTEDDMIKQKLLPLDGLKTDIVEVSFFVEYIKMKAGFPTNPSHY
ncbi:MAG: hypothetical protein ACTHLE_10715 [Agriterribacter sp.]